MSAWTSPVQKEILENRERQLPYNERKRNINHKENTSTYHSTSAPNKVCAKERPIQQELLKTAFVASTVVLGREPVEMDVKIRGLWSKYGKYGKYAILAGLVGDFVVLGGG